MSALSETFNVLGASVRGTRHCLTDTPCQDAHAYRLLSDGALIAAVADGVGSAKRADVGAELSVVMVLQSLEKALTTGDPPSETEEWTHTMKRSFTRAREGLEEAAEVCGVPLNDFATTLLTVAIIRDTLIIGHIGDGAVVGCLNNHTLKTLSKPQKGQYVNEVTPLTASDYLSRARFFSLRIGGEVEALAMLSDGLERLCLDVRTWVPYLPFFAPIFERLTKPLNKAEATKDLANWLSSERVCTRTDDDLTLLLIGKAPSASRSSEEDAKPALSAKSDAAAPCPL